MFALAAPLAAFASYFGLVRVSWYGNKYLFLHCVFVFFFLSLLSFPPVPQVMYVVQVPITGVAMLFSGGTFLYVATVHVLNELVQGHSADTDSGTGNSKLSKLELLVLTCGSLLPIAFSILHSH